MATEMQLKVLFGKKSRGRLDFKKEKTTTLCTVAICNNHRTL